MFIFLSSEERQQKRVSEQLEDVEQETATVIPGEGGGERAEEIKQRTATSERVKLGGKLN